MGRRAMAPERRSDFEICEEIIKTAKEITAAGGGKTGFTCCYLDQKEKQKERLERRGTAGVTMPTLDFPRFESAGMKLAPP